MADLDFDELDKAVNSLMTGVDTSKRNPALDDPEDTIVTLSDDASASAENPERPAPVGLTPTSELEPTPEEPEPQPAQEAPAPATPALAVKRRGQFMDMIHPSSDMKSAPRPVRREGIGIAPAPVAAPVPEVSAPTAEVIDDTAPAPLTSPFLPGARPEKRPLGGPAPVDVPAVENAADTTVEDQVPATAAVDVSQVLPEELGNDILAVEANDLTGNTAEPTHPAPAEPAAPEASEEASAEQPDVATEVLESPGAPEVPGTPEPPAGGSIPQQYAEIPSTGDQTSGSIYDTSNYHQPVTPPAAAKKSSPLKWVFLGIIMLVLGAAAGIGYFFLMH